LVKKFPNFKHIHSHQFIAPLLRALLIKDSIFIFGLGTLFDIFDIEKNGYDEK